MACLKLMLPWLLPIIPIIRSIPAATCAVAELACTLTGTAAVAGCTAGSSTADGSGAAAAAVVAAVASGRAAAVVAAVAAAACKGNWCPCITADGPAAADAAAVSWAGCEVCRKLHWQPGNLGFALRPPAAWL